MSNSWRLPGGAAAALAAALGLAWGAPDLGADPNRRPAAESVVPSISPTSGVHHNNLFVENDDSALRVVPDHPPFEEMIPAMPEWSPPVGLPVDGAPIVYDVETGVERVLPGDWTDRGGQARGGGYDGAFGPFDEEPWLEAFNDMSQITNTGASPWRMNVKLAMRFTRTNGTSFWSQCSGVMMDARTVFTAGHCIYWRDAFGNNVFDWADEVWVYPGWDGVGPLSNPGTDGWRVDTHGAARSITFASWTTWTQNGNFDGDVGLIRVDRPVGMLTGWFGWAYGGSCSWHTSTTYNNASYPAENCPDTGFHNGRRMMYWFGTFDACPNNQLQLNTTGGCFNAAWGGMSGSGAYYIDGGSRFVHATASTSNRSTRAWYCRKWQSWVDYMNGTFIPNSRGNTFDLAALRCELDNTTIQAGTQVGGSTRRAFITNPTNAARSAQSYTLRVYLSTNDLITTSDTLLATYTYSNVTFNSMSSLNFLLGNFTIPANTTPGNYFIGVILDPGTDSNPSNNATNYWDAQPVTITLAAPGQATNPNPPNGSSNRPVTQNLSWGTAPRATSYRVNFGTSPGSLSLLGTTSSTSWTLPTLTFNTTYYWRIDSVNSAGTTTGNVWSFTTEQSGGTLNVAIAAAAASSPTDARFTDPRDKLMATGQFATIDFIDVMSQTPTLAELQQYDAILTWTNFSYQDGAALGNVLANYVDAGGGVVVAEFALGTTTSNRFLSGRWITDGYEIVPSQGGTTSTAASLGTIHDPGHPIMQGVSNLSGSTIFRPTTTSLSSHGEKIAEWNDGRTLVAVSNQFPTRVDLGLYPPSSDVNSGWWTGDGATLMANALAYAASGTPGGIISNFQANPGVGTAYGVNTTTQFKAFGFTMGSDSYTLNGVVLSMDFQDPGANPIVSIWSGASAPQTQLIALNNPPGLLGPGEYVFTPSSSFTLQSGQTYWVHLRPETVGQGPRYLWDGTSPSTMPTGPGATAVGYIFNGSPSTFLNRLQVNGTPSADCPPDWNGDGVVDSDDLFDFLADWAAGNADYNGDGVTDSDDLFDFLSDFANPGQFPGC